MENVYCTAYTNIQNSIPGSSILLPNDIASRNPGKGPCSLAFQGGSQEALRDFPAGAKHDLGYALYRLQLGQIPPDRKRVRTVGAGVYELPSLASYRKCLDSHCVVPDGTPHSLFGSPALPCRAFAYRAFGTVFVRMFSALRFSSSRLKPLYRRRAYVNVCLLCAQR
jgi:hypothetical protein